MSETIHSLYQFSLLLNRPGLSRRYLHSTTKSDYDPRVLHFATHDFAYIQEKLNQWKSQPKMTGDEEKELSEIEIEQRKAEDESVIGENELSRRLAKANTKRREQLDYWKRHPDVLPTSSGQIEHQKSSAETGLRLLSANVESESQQFEAPAAKLKQEDAIIEIRAPRSSATKQSFSTMAASDIYDSQTKVGPARTIYAESTVGNKRSNRVPSIPKSAKENPYFECPYCHTLLDSEKMSSRLNWK